MQQFAVGFICALVVIIFAVLIVRKRFCITCFGKTRHVKKFEQLSKLTGQLTHEIKNPLSTIKVNLKLISEELDRFKTLESDVQANQKLGRVIRKISVVQKEAGRLEQILDGFLRYIDKVEPVFAETDINELVSEMVDFYSPQAYTHSITMRLGLHSERLTCKIDADMLKQVLLNLFINAQQAMTAGGELMIKTFRDKEFAKVQISDTGSGIESSKLHKIFDAYYSSRLGGVGLGLPTVKKIIEAHNGSITVNSEFGKGTSFTITLPVVI